MITPGMRRACCASKEGGKKVLDGAGKDTVPKGGRVLPRGCGRTRVGGTKAAAGKAGGGLEGLAEGSLGSSP